MKKSKANTGPDNMELKPLDLMNVTNKYRGNEHLVVSLERIKTTQDLLRTLGQYVGFSAAFGASVAVLAGNVGLNRDLFSDPDEDIGTISDRSNEIAARIFAAAIDEFDGCNPQRLLTHRRMGQQVLKTAGKFYGYDGKDLDSLIKPSAMTRLTVDAMQEGYGFGKEQITPQALLEGIGFHAGSEMLAAEEFRIFDQLLRDKHPELVGYMSNVNIATGGIQAYTWFKIHTIVEDEHAAHALAAANLAINYYGDPGTAREKILTGADCFAKLQAKFMEHIADG